MDRLTHAAESLSSFFDSPTWAVTPGEDFTGGEFVMTEQRPRMQTRPMVVPLRRGDAVIFAVHHRPVKGTRGSYRVNLRHGVSRLRSGQRSRLELFSMTPAEPVGMMPGARHEGRPKFRASARIPRSHDNSHGQGHAQLREAEFDRPSVPRSITTRSPAATQLVWTTLPVSTTSPVFSPPPRPA